jgi:PHD/YefM family antitoxin component YafN of YafNO toxin-antitoxin module
LIETIKSAFHKKRVKITVQEVYLDETDYLLSTDANRKNLKEPIKHLERGEGIRFTLEEFEAYTNKL